MVSRATGTWFPMNDADNYYKSLIAESASRRPRRLRADPVDHAAAVIDDPHAPVAIEEA